jgi:hypothetical protein
VAALPGQIISTIPDGSGATAIQVVIFFNPANGSLRNGTFTTSAGVQNGAIIADNLTGRTQRVVVRDGAGVVLRSVTIRTTDRAFTAAQCAAAGFSTTADIAGLTFELT